MSHDLAGNSRLDPPSHTGRHETENERLDRNWNEILQELRVTQTGSQILTGFLLALAFQPRFEDLDDFQVRLYLVLVGLAAVSTALGLGPVSLHRTLFRQRRKDAVVAIGDKLVQGTLLCIGLLVTGVVVLIFDVVVSRSSAFLAGAGALVLVAVLWVAVPLTQRWRGRR